MTLQHINEAGSLILALGTGIYAYPYMNKFIRTLFFQLLVWIPFYIAGYVLTYYQASHGMEENNQVIANIHTPIEFLLLMMATSYLLTDKMSRSLRVILYIFFTGTFLVHVLFSGILVFANYAVAVSGFAITILYILILSRSFKSDPSSSKYSPEIWASLGLIIYAACIVPYLTMINYLNEHHPELSTRLFHLITDVLANIRYLLLAVAFWLVRKNRATFLSNAT